MSYETILFDLDNTLYDYNAYWRWRLTWSLEPVGVAYPHMDMVSLRERIIAEHIYAGRLVDFLHRVGITDESACAAALERYRINSFDQLQLYPDTRSALHQLRQRYRLGLITNGPIFSQRPKIRHLGLEEVMDVLVISEEVGCAKPDPSIFHLALQQIDSTPEQALYVGDSLQDDLLGAYAAGLDFVWMNTDNHVLPPGMPAPLAHITGISMLLTLLHS
jgi:putative hydrolase of the HAD superfamily